jgi:LmbE family N-acetylglucosaminyl deacetylase
MLDALAGTGSLDARLMIVAAHPDDETIGVGAQLHRLRDALIVHVTDGAPRDGGDAAALGFPSVAAYAAARRLELAASLAAGGAARIRTETLGIADQEGSCDLAALTRRILDLLRSERPDGIVAHSYEGGHPDHDAAAFAVHAACRLLTADGRPTPAIIEMALYHACEGRRVAGRFPPGGDVVRTIALDARARLRKRNMFDCFATQRSVLDTFEIGFERFRAAPDYDFRLPPHPGPLLYESFGWGETGERWREGAAAALAALDFP